MKLVEEIVPFNVEHNAEVEALDLLMEVRTAPSLLVWCLSDPELVLRGVQVERLDMLPPLLNKDNTQRITKYLLRRVAHSVLLRLASVALRVARVPIVPCSVY